MTKSRRWIVVAGLLVILLVAGAGTGALLLTGQPQPVANPQAFEKGGQIEAPPTASPQATGPVAPTFAPVSRAQPSPTIAEISRAQPSPTGTEVKPTATPNPFQGIIPWKIKIPAIGVNTYVERVGVTREGLMDVPKNIWNTAWFGEGGYRPGDPGNAVIAGHLDAPGTKAIFWDLDKLKAGDKIMVSDAEGRELTFEVQRREIYPFDNAPLLDIFGPSNEARLNLITCGGTFDRTSRNYNKRLVVFTRLAPER